MIDPAALPPDTRFGLPVVETFHSLQGEGLHAGRSAFFLRLGGCAVGCPWCDTKHSWPADAHPQRSLAELIGEARAAASAGAAFAVITGGEPLEHDLGPLCAALAQAAPQLPLHLETSGAAPLTLSGRFDWITLSPKRHRPPSAELLAACDELKVVVHEPADLVFAEAMAERALAERAEAARALAAQALEGRRDRALACTAGTGDRHEAMTAEQAAGRQAGRAPAEARAMLDGTAAMPGGSAMSRPCRVEAGDAAGTVQEAGEEAMGEGGAPDGGHVARAGAGPALLLQPGWNCRRGQELAIAFVRSHPAWRLSLQSHKWLGVR